MGLGVALISATWALAALLGLGELLRAHPVGMRAAQMIGGLYLVWLGVTLWRARPSHESATSTHPVTRTGLWRAFRDGALTNLSNPKSLLFYGALFSTLAPANASNQDLALLAATPGVIAALWYCSLALSVSAMRRWRGASYWGSRVGGGVLVAFGVAFLTIR
ncbi:LysE family translocator [Magnetofaba australis]|uniref:LysE family translocator n=1 Tax=Magnetofaba australis TaxID=1472297 RepID=UPI000A19DE5D|nr:LysE family translocator [Magnetofaba australis]